MKIEDMTEKGQAIVRDILKYPEMPLALFQERFGINSQTLNRHCGMSWSELRTFLGLPKLSSGVGRGRKLRRD